VAYEQNCGSQEKDIDHGPTAPRKKRIDLDDTAELLFEMLAAAPITMPSKEYPQQGQDRGASVQLSPASSSSNLAAPSAIKGRVIRRHGLGGAGPCEGGDIARAAAASMGTAERAGRSIAPKFPNENVQSILGPCGGDASRLREDDQAMQCAPEHFC